jgi:Protein of unknown function (DUF3800)
MRSKPSPQCGLALFAGSATISLEIAVEVPDQLADGDRAVALMDWLPSLLPGGEGCVGMLTAYFDDSGTHRDSEVVLWYGLFGNNFQWDHFDKLWAAKLKQPSPGKPPLRRFHMAECQAADGEFLGWSRTATDFLVHELGEIILKCGLWVDGVVIPRKEWNDLITGDLRIALGDAEGYSLRIAFVRASRWARLTGGENKIAFVFDARVEKEAEGKRIFQLFEHLAKTEANAVKPISIAFSDSTCIRPLQAADMVAWEMYQHTLGYVKSGGSPYEGRRQLRRLWQGKRMDVGFATRTAIEKMVAIESSKEKEEHIAKAAELLTISDDEFARRLNEPIADSGEQPSET